MTVGRVLGAVGCFVVFGALAIVMGRSASADWREGQAADDAGTKFLAVGQWWPAILSGLLALFVPIVLVTTSP